MPNLAPVNSLRARRAPGEPPCIDGDGGPGGVRGGPAEAGAEASPSLEKEDEGVSGGVIGARGEDADEVWRRCGCCCCCAALAVVVVVDVADG
jgi:hypothetical protein